MIIQVVEGWFYDYYDCRLSAPPRNHHGHSRDYYESDDKYGGSYDDLDEKPSWNRGRK